MHMHAGTDKSTNQFNRILSIYLVLSPFFEIHIQIVSFQTAMTHLTVTMYRGWRLIFA